MLLGSGAMSLCAMIVINLRLPAEHENELQQPCAVFNAMSPSLKHPLFKAWTFFGVADVLILMGYICIKQLSEVVNRICFGGFTYPIEKSALSKRG